MPETPEPTDLSDVPDLPELTHRESIRVEVDPDRLYALVSDVERTGEWSPVCRSCGWEDGGGPEVGAWFTGVNEAGGRTWETRSEVVVADPGRAFVWQVGGTFVRWGYELAPVEGGATELTETWEFLPAGLAMFSDKYGADAPAQIRDRAEQAHAGIPRTLASIKEIAERGDG